MLVKNSSILFENKYFLPVFMFIGIASVLSFVFVFSGAKMATRIRKTNLNIQKIEYPFVYGGAVPFFIREGKKIMLCVVLFTILAVIYYI